MLYTLLLLKIFVVMAIIARIDTTAFYIVMAKKIGDGIIVLRRIPVTFAELALLSLIFSVITIYAYDKLVTYAPNEIKELLTVINEE